MKHLKKYETHSHHREDIIEILNNWIDDLDFDISKEPDFQSNLNGIVYSILEISPLIIINIYHFNYNNKIDDKISKDFKSLGPHINDLVHQYESAGYSLVCFDNSDHSITPGYKLEIDTYITKMKYLNSFEAKKWNKDFPTIKKFSEIEDTEEDTEETPLNTKEDNDDRTPCIYCGSKDHMWAACPIYISTQIINQSTMF